MSLVWMKKTASNHLRKITVYIISYHNLKKTLTDWIDLSFKVLKCSYTYKKLLSVNCNRNNSIVIIIP